MNGYRSPAATVINLDEISINIDCSNYLILNIRHVTLNKIEIKLNLSIRHNLNQSVQLFIII